MRSIIALGVGLFAATVPLSTSAVQRYIATPLCPPGFGGNGINNRGDVTGTGPTNHASICSGGTLHDLGDLGGGYSTGYHVNDSMQVTGDSTISNQINQHAFLFADGTTHDLGTLGGKNSQGRGINASGQVVGYADTNNGVLASNHAFVYSNGTMHDLGTLGGTHSAAYGINDSGQITGYADTAGDAVTPAFLYANGAMHNLGTLGGNFAAGFGINSGGQATGVSVIAGNVVQHAFLYSGGAMQDLGALPGTSFSFGQGINNSGLVVGVAVGPPGSRGIKDSGPQSVAFLYSDGAMYDLNSLVVSGLDGASLIDAQGINDSGQILANGCHGGAPCNSQAYRLDPIPAATPVPTISTESLAAMAMLLGFVALAALAKR